MPPIMTDDEEAIGFKPLVWIVAVGEDRPVLSGFAFPMASKRFKSKQTRKNWRTFANRCLHDHQQQGSVAFLVAALARDLDPNHRIEFMRVEEMPTCR